MQTHLDCIPCFLRQALEAARMVTPEQAVHEQILNAVMRWAVKTDWRQPPPLMGQRIHRKLREITGNKNPYRQAKERQNRMALSLMPAMRAMVEAAKDPLAMAARLAVAGNTIDMGAKGEVSIDEVNTAVNEGLAQRFYGRLAEFRRSAAKARNLLYLADNAGEIVFDRLLIEQLGPERITVAVRGAPVINDATRADAQAAGLHDIVAIVDNGSDAPGTLLSDCSREFVRRFAAADLIIAKGQGNFETLSEIPAPIFFLLIAKCPVIADHVGQPVGTHILWPSCAGRADGAPRPYTTAAERPPKPQ